MYKVISLFVIVLLVQSCISEEKKHVIRINKKYENGYKLDYMSKEEAPELNDVWDLSNYFIDNQSFETLNLDEIKYSMIPSEVNSLTKTIEIKPGINHQLPVIRGMGDIYILRKPPETTNTFKGERELSKWYLHY
jgi:hypothetical protein